jgi:hypothetical protein
VTWGASPERRAAGAGSGVGGPPGETGLRTEVDGHGLRVRSAGRDGDHLPPSPCGDAVPCERGSGPLARGFRRWATWDRSRASRRPSRRATVWRRAARATRRFSDAGQEASCPPRTAPGPSTLETVSADTTGKAADGPHLVTSRSRWRGADPDHRALRRVVFEGGYRHLGGGAVVARGTEARPITFDTSDPSRPWGKSSLLGTVDLAWATLKKAARPTPWGRGGRRGPRRPALPRRRCYRWTT